MIVDNSNREYFNDASGLLECIFRNHEKSLFCIFYFVAIHALLFKIDWMEKRDYFAFIHTAASSSGAEEQQRGCIQLSARYV